MTAGEIIEKPSYYHRLVKRRGFLRVFGVKVPKVRPVSEAHEYAKIPYITHGYRVGYNYIQCIASFLTLHNETLNVWTHFAGFCWFLHLLWGLFWYEDYSELTIPEILAISIFMAAALSCMLFSTFYHLFMCHSEHVCQCVLSLDLTGISLLIGGSYFPGVTLGFHCEPTLQLVYGGMATCILLAGIYLSQAKFEKHDTKAKGFAILTAVGAFPAAHWIINTPDCYRNALLPSLIGMFGFYGLGFVFYSARFPESVWPGKFNYFFSSHQIWHVCVFAAVYVWYQNVMISKKIVDSDICSIEPSSAIAIYLSMYSRCKSLKRDTSTSKAPPK